MPTTHITSLLRDKPLLELQFPCHTQAIERCVKLVTEAAGKVCEHDKIRVFVIPLSPGR